MYVLGFVDFNCPGARVASKMEMLTQGISLVNDCGNMSKNACMVLMPDLPKDSSMRGLWDEERKIIENLFSYKQDVETRFVDLFTREPKSENRSSSRRFSSGRLVVNSEAKEANEWLDSELAIYGRPVGRQEGSTGAPTSVLPRVSAMLFPEAASPDQDLKLADRVRPSPEQTCAQKGAARLELLIEAALRHTKINGPLLLVNFTGYVEELAAAVLRTKIWLFFFFANQCNQTLLSTACFRMCQIFVKMMKSLMFQQITALTSLRSCGRGKPAI